MESTCALCYGLLSNPYAYLICKHTCCVRCIEEWRRKERAQGYIPRCPTCKVEFGHYMKKNIVSTPPNAPSALTCNYCHRVFGALYLLRKHKQEDHAQKCPLCPMLIPMDSDRHFYDTHYFPCEACEELYFADEDARADHARTLHSVCEECGHVYATDDILAQHYVDHHPGVKQSAKKHSESPTEEETDFPCPHCDRSFFLVFAREQHILAAHPNKVEKNGEGNVDGVHTAGTPLVTSVSAAKTIPDANNIWVIKASAATAHATSGPISKGVIGDQKRDLSPVGWNTPPLKLTCEHCDVTFETRMAYDQHVREKHAEGCQYCSAVFTLHSQLDRHILELHPRCCALCTATFESIPALQQHQRVAHYHTCPHCPANEREVFTTALALERHVSENHVFYCKEDNCDKVFATERGRQMHWETVHKAFVCPRCSVVFRTRKDLDLHQLDAHYCPHCDDYVDGAFEQHKALHICTFCQHHFKFLGDLPSHISEAHTCWYCHETFNDPYWKLVHEKEQHQCGVCGHFFATSELRWQHYRDTHERR